VTGSGAPTGGHGPTARGPGGSDGELVGVAKRSLDKISIAGGKWALRRVPRTASRRPEVIGVGHSPADDGDDRPLLRRLVDAASRWAPSR
jgi:nicotinate phosphoribosyltransferase